MTVGASRMPARPAIIVLVTQTPMATRPGFVPESPVMASESTRARTLSPVTVKRRTRPPTSKVSATAASTITWSRLSVTPVPNTFSKVSTGSGASPGTNKIVSWASTIGANTRTRAGSATETPMVQTIFTSCDDSRSKRNTMAYSTTPRSGATMSSETPTAGRMPQLCSEFR